MKVAFGCDHGGFILKQIVLDEVKKLGHEILDFGTDSDTSVDYPDYAFKVAKSVQKGESDRGILICGSGIGVCITANKFKGIRASIAHDVYSASQGVMHDKMNILCLGGRIIDKAMAVKLVKAFLEANFEYKEERHLRRTNKVENIEKENFK